MKLVISHPTYRPVRLEVFGLLDEIDAHILATECLHLLEDGHRAMMIDLSGCTRLSDEACEVFVNLVHGGHQQMAYLLFVAPQRRLYQHLLKWKLPAQQQGSSLEFEKEKVR